MRTGEKLRAWRDRVGMSQEKAAKTVGTFQPQWRLWEIGDRFPNIEFAAAIERLTEGEITMHEWAREQRVTRLQKREAKAAAAAEESGHDINEAVAEAS